MSTKNLARTVIEGGRRGFNKWERRYSHKETRADQKAYLSEVKEDNENWYEYDIEPTRPIYKEFTDKLNPMQRWLSSQVGRLWDDVRSDVAKTFDTRTTAGRHIVHDHLLSSVEVTPDLRYGRYYYGPEDYTQSYHAHDFYVDAGGFLREKTVIRRKQKIPKFDGKQIANWLTGRVVGFVGDKLFWFTPTGKNRKHRSGSQKLQWTTVWGQSRAYYYAYNPSPLRYLYVDQEPIHKKDKDGKTLLDENGRAIVESYQAVWKDGRPTFRQDRKLNDKEIAFWNTIPEYYQACVLKYSPTYVETPEEIAARKRYYF